MQEKKLKVAFFIGNFPQISESWFVEQLTTLLDMGVAIDLFAFKRGDARHISEKVLKYHLLEKVTYIECPEKRIVRYLLAIPLLVKVALRKPSAFFRLLSYGRYAVKHLFWIAPLIGKIESYNIVHCHFGMIANRFLIIRHILGLSQRFVTTFYGQDSSKYIKAKGIGVYKKLMSEGSHFLLMTEEMKERFTKLGFPQEKLLVHYTGVNPDYYVFNEKNYDSRGVFRVICVGRFVEKKGIDDALRAIKIIIEKGKNVHFHIVGGGTDTSYEKYLIDLAHTLGIEKHISWEGLLPHAETLSLFKQMHLMMQLSKTAANGDTDDLPFVILEAQVSGLPIVTTRHVGIPDGVLDERTGFLVKEGDYAAAAEKIIYLVDHPAVLRQFSTEARGFVMDRFNVYTLNERLIRLYQSLLDK